MPSSGVPTTAVKSETTGSAAAVLKINLRRAVVKLTSGFRSRFLTLGRQNELSKRKSRYIAERGFS